jgi:NADPH:quinone reductase-like Zn-dependent oxidoreductase
MKAAILTQKNGEFKITELPIPKPGAGEVLVKLESTTINPSDLLVSSGAFGPVQYPTPLGLEGFGTVTEAGDEAGQKLISKKVSFWSLKSHSWAQYTTVPISDLIVLEDSYPAELGANSYLNPITCLGLLERVQQGGHKAVIISAAASHCGKLLLHLCNEAGLKTIAIVRRDDMRDHIQAYNPTVVLNSSDNEFDEQVQKHSTELNATILIDCVNGSFTARVLKNMPPGGTAVIYGFLSGEGTIPIDSGSFVMKGQTLSTFFITAYVAGWSDEKRVAVHEKAREFMKRFEAKSHAVLRLDDISEAVKIYTESASKGKIVILI